MKASPLEDPEGRSGAIRWMIRETAGNLILIALLFGIVGRWDWWAGWALSGIYIVWSVATAVLILPVNPEMLAERARPRPGTKRWDTILLVALGVAMLAEYVVASMDARWGWTPSTNGATSFPKPLPPPWPTTAPAASTVPSR